MMLFKIRVFETEIIEQNLWKLPGNRERMTWRVYNFFPFQENFHLKRNGMIRGDRA